MQRASSLNSWRELLLPKEGHFWAGVMILNLGLSSAIGWAIPGLTQEFYAAFGGEGSYEVAFSWLLGAFVLEYINRFGYSVATYQYVTRVLDSVRTETFSKWLMAPLKIRRAGKSGDEFPMGEVMARVMSDSEALRELITTGAFTIFIDIAFILAALAGFMRLGPSTGIALTVVEALVCWGLLWGSKKMAVVFMEVRTSTGMMSRILTDVTNGLRELWYTPHVNYARVRGEKVCEEFLSKQLRANVWDASYYAAAESLYPILLALILAVFPVNHAGSVALLAALIDLIQKSINPIKEIASKISGIQRAKTGIDRIREFHTHFDGQEFSRHGSEVLTEAPEEMTVDLHSFTHPPKEGEEGFELKDIKLHLKRGQMVGVVGISGCGKSTLMRLLAGQFGPFNASVSLDGRELKLHERKDLYTFTSLASLVSQESHVFTESLRFNLALGEGTEKDVEEFWARACTAVPYLIHWGIGLATMLKPTDLSLGQKQLISALRACYLQRPLVMLDEVSAGLDPELEKALRDLVIFVQRQAMGLVVTHRLETILNAHEVILMEKGRIKARGSVSELRQNSPDFREFLSHLNS